MTLRERTISQQTTERGHVISCWCSHLEGPSQTCPCLPAGFDSRRTESRPPSTRLDVYAECQGHRSGFAAGTQPQLPQRTLTSSLESEPSKTLYLHCSSFQMKRYVVGKRRRVSRDCSPCVSELNPSKNTTTCATFQQFWWCSQNQNRDVLWKPLISNVQLNTFGSPDFVNPWILVI